MARVEAYKSQDDSLFANPKPRNSRLISAPKRRRLANSAKAPLATTCGEMCNLSSSGVFEFGRNREPIFT